MAEVWFAHRALGAKGTKSVALKLIADHFVGDERYARMFQAEAELAAVLSHANIVQVFDEGIDNGRSYLVMEWVDGLNLLKLGAGLAMLDNEDRRFRVISYIIGQLLYALGYAHSITSFDGSPLGVVHRDVSPQNVLVSNQGEVKLTDFGVAYHVLEESSGMHVKGKVRYMSPEQLAGKTRAPTVDLYAVGALLHELLDGKKFRGEYEDGQEMFTAVLSGTIPPLSRKAPPELNALRMRLLARRPEHRLQSAEEAIDWLRRYPAYGDARGELTKLCRNETGIVRPRVGPHLSTSVAMVDRRTLQFKGSSKLAKPRVDDNRDRAAQRTPPPPLRRPREGPILPTGSMTTLKVKEPRRVRTPDVVIGHTQAVHPRYISTIPRDPRRSDASPRHAAASTPQPIAAPGTTAPPYSRPVPVELEGRHPSLFPRSGATSGPVPSPIPSSISSPVSGAPHPPSSVYRPPDSSGMIPMSARPAMVPLEVSPHRSEGTEVIDANMIVELGNNPTEEELGPGTFSREGTELSRTYMQPHSHSISITVHKRMAAAVVVFGLLLVAAMSTFMAVWAFDWNKHNEMLTASESPTAHKPSEGATLSNFTLPMARDVHESASRSSTRARTPTAKASRAKASTPHRAQRVNPRDSASASASVVEPTASEPPTMLAEPRGEHDEHDEQVPASPSALPTSSENAPPLERPTGSAHTPQGRAAPTKHRKKATVRITGVPTVVGYQVKIASSLVTIPDKLFVTKTISAGRKKVQWRRSKGDPWKTSTPLVLRPGKQSKLILTSRGLR